MTKKDPALGQALARQLVDALVAAGWMAAWTPEGTLSLYAEAGEYAAVLLTAAEARYDQLESLLANALLRSAVLASPGQQPLALVGAPALSERHAAALAGYVARFAPGRAYGLLDLRGRLTLVGPGLAQVAGTPRPAVRAPVLARPGDLFTDLHQWGLKVLWQHQLAGTPLATATRLSQAAGLSLPTASRLLRAAKAAGHLEVREDGLALTDLARLLPAWHQAVGQQPGVPGVWEGPERLSERVGARALLGGADALPDATPDAQLPLVHVEDLGRLAESRLALTDEQPHVRLVPARFPEATFRGRVGACCDELQATFDLPLAEARRIWGTRGWV